MRQYIIESRDGQTFCNKKQKFVPHPEGKRYGSRAMAQKSLNTALAKSPSLGMFSPEIELIFIHENLCQ